MSSRSPAPKVALITGASSGMGKETAKRLLAAGYTVYVAARRRALMDDLAALGAIPLTMDITQDADVRQAVATIEARHGGVDVLINNAGVMAPPLQRSAQGFELQLGVNHLGHFALTQALLPLLEQRPGARVVHVSSGAAYFGRIAFDDLHSERRYDPWGAYGQSKLANVMTALELQRRLDQRGSAVQSLVAHPGLARTNLQPTSVAARGSRLEALAYRLMDPLFQSAAMGALPQLFAATAAEAQAGVFYGPGGPANLKGHPKPCRMPPAALDAAACARLWEMSAAAVNLQA